MFKSKSIKVILAWLCVVILLMPYFSQVIAVEKIVGEKPDLSEVGKITENTSSAKLTSIFPRNGELGYKINNYGILKIVNTEGTETEDNFYCLEPNKSFPEAVTENYNNVGNLENLSIEKILSYKQELGEEKYNSILWLSKNICMQEASDEKINSYIAKAFEEFIDYTYNRGEQFVYNDKTYDGTSDENEYKAAYIQTIREYLTEEDINVSQQIALWYLTNPTDNRYYDNKDIYTGNEMENYKNGYNPETGFFLYNVPAISLEKIEAGEDSTIEDINNITKKYLNILTNYLITNAKRHENISETVNYPTIDKTKQAVATVAGNNDEYYVVGPFKINSNGATNSNKYEIKLSVDNYEIFEDKECTNKIEENIQSILDKEYFVRISSKLNVSKVTLNINYNSTINRVATIWESEDATYQKMILITEQETKKEPESISVLLEQGDLALRKYIVSINGDTQNRIPDVNIDGLIEGTSNTAIYNHSKNPLEVECGNTIVYQINVYNEGTIDAIAKEITDYLPQGLTFVENSKINEKYGWKISSDGRVATTNALSDVTLLALNKEDKTIASGFVQIECKVDDNLKAESVLTNVAEITSDNIKDRDSDVKSIDNNTINDTFSGNVSNKEDLSDSKYYYKGLQDDDDFEKVIIKGQTFDLSLQKFITSINGENPKTSREPIVDTTNLKNGTSTNATYKTVKTPLTVESGDIVKYTIRVYNESSISGYAEEVADYLPEGLGLLVNYNDNIDNYWSISKATEAGAKTIKLSEINNGTSNLKLTDFTGETKLEDAIVLVGKGAKITSTKLSSNKESNLLEKYDGVSNKLNYKDIEVTCIVVADNLKDEQLKNIAEITEDLDENKKEIEDRDSIPNSIDINNYPGNDKNQDDHDYENLTQEEKIFDLSLQKFITGLNDKEITDRTPIVTKDSENKLKYNHTTEPLSVANTDLVTYTIRVYNEGEKAGYAAEIQDDIPNGLTFVVDNEINKKYEWKMYDKYGKETTDINQATTVKTKYLSKEVSEARGEDALLQAYDETKQMPDYLDVKIVFKVDDSKVEATTTTEKRIIINTAEISEDTDENGKDVEDNDSIPNNGKDEEDDIDKERIYVKYFDLALEKYLTKIIITEDGQTREILATDKDSLLKVEVHRKKINSTVVKFMYDIIVTNEGEIEGFSTEIKDYIPDGLKFVAEDNKDWTQISEKEIVTNALAKTLLEPGKSATIQVTLTWINGEDNLGTKVNIAEISEDYNEKGDTPDIDSTPNNKVDGEDDIDDAPVMLTISTGSTPTYIGLIFTITIILTTGIVLIKKFVL
ncbi:MAG: hypothetical protein ACI4UE_06055 [Candidatus Scatovivens sp.]